MRVLRHSKRFTEEDFEALASSLRRLYREQRRIASVLNHRVLAKWLDPLATGGKSLRYFDELRSALDDEEAQFFPRSNRFFGWGDYCDNHSHTHAQWLTWNEDVGGEVSALRLLCRQCVGLGGNRQRELGHFERMSLPEFAGFLCEYKWGREDMIKLFRLWSEGRL